MSHGAGAKPASVDEHAALVSELLTPALVPRSERVSLDDALGRVTAGDVSSPVDLPLFRNSQMDGFAVNTHDLETLPVTLPVVGEVAARPGVPEPLAAGTTVRIMTGAPVPEGADAVVPVEDTVVDAADRVTISVGRSVGEFVRDRGDDVRAGDILVPSGRRLASRHLGVLAATGLTTVEVRARVRVTVITTGSELVQPGAAPVYGQLFDANATALVAAVRAVGAEVTFRAHVADDTTELTRALTDARTAADIILTSGGISMGDHEVVRQTLEPLGASVGHVAMQPGGPQATGSFEGTPVICFPGNPVSTQISFEVFVAPLLRRAAAIPEPARQSRALRGATRSPSGKRQFLRGRADGADGVVLTPGAGSHLVAGLAASDLLVVVPEGVAMLAEGDSVETWAL